MATATEILNLDKVAQRREGARFELRSISGDLLGGITPNVVVAIENRSDGVLKRTVTNFALSADVAADVNPLSDRVWAYWRLSTGDEYPLGRFLFASWVGNRRSYGIPVTTRLLDQGLLLADSPPYSIGFPAGAAVTACLATVFEQAGVYAFDIANSVATLSTPQAWPAGAQTTWARIASDLCGLSGLSDWFFDNNGLLRVVPLPDLAAATPTLAYDAGRNIIAGSAIEQNDNLNAPNRYIAIDTANRDRPIVGVYDLPASAPNSYDVSGRRVTKIIEAPGIASNDAAAAYAQTYAQTDPRSYELVTFSGAPDPRHDTFDVVRYLGVNYQELSWKLTCAPGGPMEHSLKRSYFL